MTPLLYTPNDANPLVEAVQWCEAAIRGPVLTSVATLAVAGIGIGMLGGRISAKRGLTCVLGCFIAFGAPTISLGILSATSNSTAALYPEQLPAAMAPPPTAREVNRDPYAGAAVPNPRIRLNDLY